MPAAPLPANEIERLSALYASELLESGPHPRLNAIVREATILWGAPMAALALVDAKHVHFKASIGLDVTPIARNEAFCAYAILQSDPLVVPDPRIDPRFADNPRVLAEPGIRFYAAVPVYGRNNQTFGALCVMDTVEHPQIYPVAVQMLSFLGEKATAVLSSYPEAHRAAEPAVTSSAGFAQAAPSRPKSDEVRLY
jgi:GAF domain-containing protein